MSYGFSRQHIFLFQTLFLTLLVHASSLCENSAFKTINSTGSATFPGITLPSSKSNGTWTISTAVSQTNDITINKSTVRQTFWLNTNPAVEANLTDIPFWGCLILLDGFSSAQTSENASTCAGVFSDDCYNAIISSVNFAAFQLEYYPPSISEVCQSLAARAPPSQCKDQRWTANLTAVPFGDVDHSDACLTDPFDGSPTSNTLLTRVSPPSSPANFSIYDSWVTNSMPIILTAFNKNVTEESPRWAQTRMVCPSANNVMMGSRVPTSSAAVISSSKSNVLLVAAICITLNLITMS